MPYKPEYITDPDFKLLKEKYQSEKKLSKVLKKIEKGYPVQYAIGNVEFMKNIIDVDKRVLIPRFETELLVSKLVKYIGDFNLKNMNILDLCTGSGCIAISLKKAFPYSTVDAVDISYRALSLARKNAKKNEVKITFTYKNILKNFKFKKKYSVLVSNPPYVRKNEEVSIGTKYEPQIALYPKDDDLIFYKKILDSCKHILEKENIIAFEIGSTQASNIVAYAKPLFPNAKILVEKDYIGYDRFIFIFNK